MLLDSDSLRACVPGVESLNETTPDHFDAVMRVGVAAIKGTYKGKVAIVDKRESNSYTLDIEGSGGPGFVKGTAGISLIADGDETLVTVEGDGQVGGLDWRSLLPRVGSPPLLVTSDPELGGIVTPEAAQEAVQLLPTLQVVRLNGAGHNIRREQFHGFLTAVRQFLANPLPRRVGNLHAKLRRNSSGRQVVLPAEEPLGFGRGVETLVTLKLGA